MGMAIDNAIEWYVGLECYTPQAKDARDVAIDTMRKYQKIEQAYSAYLETMNPEILADLISTII